MNRRRVGLGAFLSLAIALVASTVASAHSGGGQPFVTVNGKYVTANTLAGGWADIAQDLAPDTYIANQTIEFGVDQAQVSADGFRWQWTDDKSDTADGVKRSHVFKRSGSHTVTLLGRQGSQDWVTIDTIGINVVPKKGYLLPTAKLKVSQTNSTADSHAIKFEVVPKTDRSTSVNEYQWDFGDGQKATGQTPEHVYNGADVSVYPKLHITDKNGLSSDIVIQLVANKDGIQPQDLPGQPPVLSDAASKNGPTKPLVPLAVAGGLLLLGALVTLQLKRLKSED